MRQFKILSILALSALVFTSCNEDDSDDGQVVGPDLDVVETTSGSVGGSIVIEQGQSLTFIWDARKGALDLQTFSVSVAGVNAVSPLPESESGQTFPYTIDNAEDELYVDTLVFNSAGLNVGMTTYTFTVNDTQNNQVSVSYDVLVESSGNILSAPQDFTWVRVGGAPATGLGQFGLEWTENSATSAIVAQDEATTMVMLDSDDWTNITTVEQLNEAIAASTAITEYTGISVTTSGTYSDYLGVVYNGNPYIIAIDEGTVVTGSLGTTVTVEGRYKN